MTNESIFHEVPPKRRRIDVTMVTSTKSVEEEDENTESSKESSGAGPEGPEGPECRDLLRWPGRGPEGAVMTAC